MLTAPGWGQVFQINEEERGLTGLTIATSIVYLYGVDVSGAVVGIVEGAGEPSGANRAAG